MRFNNDNRAVAGMDPDIGLFSSFQGLIFLLALLWGRRQDVFWYRCRGL